MKVKVILLNSGRLVRVLKLRGHSVALIVGRWWDFNISLESNQDLPPKISSLTSKKRDAQGNCFSEKICSDMKVYEHHLLIKIHGDKKKIQIGLISFTFNFNILGYK